MSILAVFEQFYGLPNPRKPPSVTLRSLNDPDGTINLVTILSRRLFVSGDWWPPGNVPAAGDC